MKKISFIIGSLYGGGAEQVAITLANGISNLGYNIELIVLHLNNSKYLDRVSSKVNLINLNTNRVRYSFLKLLKYLYNNKPDIIIAFDYQLTLLLNLLNLFFIPRLKIISRCMNTLSYRLKNNNVFLKYINKVIVKIAYKYSDLIISQSKGMKNDLKNYFKIKDNKIIVINNPLNEIIESHFDDEINTKDNYLLCVGRLEQQKNYNLVLEAFAQISSKYPYLKLKFAGIGSLKEQLVDLSIKLGIQNKVEFLGFVSGEKLIDYYKRAKLTLLSSFFEGFPNILIESICLGTPIVSVNCNSGPSEIIVDEVNGILVDNYSIKDFAEAIRKGLEFKWNYRLVKDSSKKYKSSLIIDKYIKTIDCLKC